MHLCACSYSLHSCSCSCCLDDPLIGTEPMAYLKCAVRLMAFDIKHTGLGLSSARGSRSNQPERRSSSFNQSERRSSSVDQSEPASRYAMRSTADGRKDRRLHCSSFPSTTRCRQHARRFVREIGTLSCINVQHAAGCSLDGHICGDTQGHVVCINLSFAMFFKVL